MTHETIQAGLAAALSDLGAAEAVIQLERPRDPTHGDVACNVALTLAGVLKRAPRQRALLSLLAPAPSRLGRDGRRHR